MTAKAKMRVLCMEPEWLGRSDCRKCAIRRTMTFSGLEDEDFDRLVDPIDNLRFPAGRIFYNQGDEGNAVYSIRHGLVKLTQTMTDGSERIVRLLGPGTLIGLEVLLDQSHRHTVTALCETEGCRITANTVKKLGMEKFWLDEKLMSHWEQHLVFADRWISELSSGTARQRVLYLLKLLVELIGDENNTVRFFGYEDMASIIGTSRETFSRIIGDLKNEGILLNADVGDSHSYKVLFPEI
jgi:CRP-like cAMP-binding protein